MGSSVGAARARVVQHAKRALAPSPPKTPKPRRRKRPHRLKRPVLLAIPGCRGIWSVLANRLDCSIGAIQKSLSQPGWELVREAFEQEKLRALGQCVQNVFAIADYGLEVGARLSANKFILEKMHPDFKPESKLVVEGGDKPINVQHVVFQIPAEVMERPVEDRMEILKRVEAQEVEANGEIHSD